MYSQFRELQIRRGIRDNSNFPYFSLKTYVVTPPLNRLDEMVLMMGHNACFYAKMWKIIPL